MRATNQNESIISQDRLAVTTERLQNIDQSSAIKMIKGKISDLDRKDDH